MSPVAGLHYFSRFYDRGADWYLDHFREISDEIAFVGEKSASYLSHPDVPARLKAMLPRARLIAQLRNPVTRAYSDYCMHFRRGQASKNIEHYLDPERTTIPRLLHDGLYFRHLSAFLQHFKAKQILVTVYEEMERSPQQVFANICRHIGIDNPVEPLDVTRRVKGKETNMLPLVIRNHLAPFKAVVAPFRQTAVFRSGRALIARPNRYPPLIESLRARLADYFRPDVEDLSALLKRDFSEWLAPAAPDAARN